VVETEKSVRILTRALTWFFLRTVQSSRKANPACMASTMMPPSKTNNTSLPDFNASMPGSQLNWDKLKQIAFRLSKPLNSNGFTCNHRNGWHHMSAWQRIAHPQGASLGVA